MTTVYFYAFISVIGISLISLIGVSTLSLRTERLRGILFLFVALAVGALLGDAFFHLLPEAFEKTDNAPQVSFLVLLGLLLFFWFEKHEMEFSNQNQKGVEREFEECLACQ